MMQHRFVMPCIELIAAIAVAGCRTGEGGSDGHLVHSAAAEKINEQVIGDSAGPVRSCQLTCAAAASCAAPDAPAVLDASHFACTNQLCEYTGCKSDKECTDYYGPNSACTEAVAGFKDCNPTCTTAADCAAPDSPVVLDASHYTCANKLCEYTGCRTNQECAVHYGPNSVCAGAAGARSCQPGCTTAADCATAESPPALDASHFACTHKLCEYKGCRTDQECAGSLGAGYACK
jgi:hypothetical protein